jgi:hypothetical protein
MRQAYRPVDRPPLDDILYVGLVFLVDALSWLPVILALFLLSLAAGS